ncbi:4-alpha-glucanotransferase [Desulfogranum mediterraneum]|uniref:4-alpha-glucanotransferase n=1 Tax=Desulfogranum mediterraneum TaxID=160661 RepID=UPI00042003FA|nr:4-alpha-glucanotransferase [Desulfogranum mediterraneum]
MRTTAPIITPQQKSSGILLPVFSLPSPHGIGDIGQTACDFIDFLHRSGQQNWQILPLGPTEPAFANSPYMSPSAFAGNPLLISIDGLLKQGLLSEGELQYQDFSPYQVDYQRAAEYKTELLSIAWQKFTANNPNGTLENFSRKQPWVADYALFQALKERYNHAPWTSWPEEICQFRKTALARARLELANEIAYFTFEQFLFYSQWEKLHRYARKKKIHIIGDLPIYVAGDSADVWANQELFQLDPETCLPTRVAGVPPDYFSATGQLWGNPIYRWKDTENGVEEALLNWWEARLRHNLALTDAVRIDHFRGFESYWSVPAEESTAINGRWVKGPGLPFFTEMTRRLGPMNIIAEDLGIITPEVNELREALGYPGMKILLFAFDGSPQNTYLPHNLESNCVIYTGTHDNDTSVGWLLSPKVTAADKERAKRYANHPDSHAGTFHRDMIHLAYSSVANLAIIPMQDILGFGNDCRTNTPGTVAGNWQWRCAARFITPALADWLQELTAFFARTPGKFQELEQP